MTSLIILDVMTILSLMALMLCSPPLSFSKADLNHSETAAEEIKDVYQNPIVSVLANDLETRINKSGAILEITSKLPEIKSAPFASSISSELHGIPKDLDIQKRKVAQDILAADKDFQVIFFPIAKWRCLFC